MYITESVAFLTICIILPVFVITIKQREAIIRLVTTFDKEKINSTIDKIDKSKIILENHLEKTNISLKKRKKSTNSLQNRK